MKTNKYLQKAKNAAELHVKALELHVKELESKLETMKLQNNNLNLSLEETLTENFSLKNNYKAGK